MRPSYAARAMLLTLALGGAAACGRDEADETQMGGDVATTPPGTATPAPATDSELRVDEVRLGRALDAQGRVTEDVDDFGVRDTLRVSVRTAGMAQNAQLTARWMFGDQLVDESTQTISPTGQAYTHFFVAKPTAWPTGDYRVVILVNGREVESEDFEIKEP